jgi:hypothetical protein
MKKALLIALVSLGLTSGAAFGADRATEEQCLAQGVVVFFTAFAFQNGGVARAIVVLKNKQVPEAVAIELINKMHTVWDGMTPQDIAMDHINICVSEEV